RLAPWHVHQLIVRYDLGFGGLLGGRADSKPTPLALVVLALVLLGRQQQACRGEIESRNELLWLAGADINLAGGLSDHDSSGSGWLRCRLEQSKDDETEHPQRT